MFGYFKSGKLICEKEARFVVLGSMVGILFLYLVFATGRRDRLYIYGMIVFPFAIYASFFRYCWTWHYVGAAVLLILFAINNAICCYRDRNEYKLSNEIRFIIKNT